LKNIKTLAKKGKLLIAGPFLGEGDLSGIYLFDVETLEEAENEQQQIPPFKADNCVWN
jgi:uncharacterized protein YciI